MRTISRAALAAVVALAASVTAVSAQKSEVFTWTRALASGKTLEIKGVNGGITATAASGSEVRVRAEKSSKKSNVGDVRIEVRESPSGYTLCAVYPTPRRVARPGRPPQRPNDCTPGPRWNSQIENNDVQVEWIVEVPRGVILAATTTNGDIDIEGIQADVSATTVNGDIEVTSTGLVRATTVNGDIDAAVGRANWNGELRFTTVNGGITLSFPANLNTQVRAQTVNGDIHTDWPLTVRGRFGPKDVSGTIGDGGRTLVMNTVNGSIEIRKK